MEQSTKVYGDDPEDATWFAHSPAAQVGTITCPVSVFWSTADVLVPIDQIGARWVQAFDPTKFPEGYTPDPLKLTSSREARLRLVDVLSEDRYELFFTPLPAGAVKRSQPEREDLKKPLDLPVSADKQWSIMILDEGPPEPQVDHLKYGIRWSREGFFKRYASAPIQPDQLTFTKLERLMDRYAGKEWLPTPLTHLDYPERERADVVRGLKTYAAASADNRRTLATLYEKLPASRRVLDASLVQELRGQASGR